MRLFSRCLIALSVFSAAAASTIARADDITFAPASDFTPALTSGTDNETTWTYNDGLYSVSSGGVYANLYQGNLPPGIEVYDSSGNSITITNDAATQFTLTQLDYTVVGTIGSTSQEATLSIYNGATLLATESLTPTITALTPDDSPAVAYTTLDLSLPSYYSSLTLVMSDTHNGFLIDNIDTATNGVQDVGTPVVPEPSSLILAGSGLLALAGAFRRRFAL